MSVTRNTLTLLVASVAQKAVAFVYFALVARWAGVEDTGKYFFALSWTLMFSTLNDLGLTSVLIRDVAKDTTKAAKYLGQVLTIKLPLIAITAVVAVGGVILLGYPPVTRTMVMLGAVVLALDGLTLACYGTLRGHQILKYESIGLVIGQLSTLVIGVTVLQLHLPIQYLVAALIVGSLYNAIASFTLVRIKLGVRPIFGWDMPFVKALFRAALPFALAGAFVKIYTSADVVLLSKLGGDTAAGLYSVPYKLTFAFQFIPMAFTAALYPAMSRYYAVDRSRMGMTFYKALWYLSLVSMPIAAGMMALAPELVLFVFGKAYLPAVPAMVALVASLPFIFLDFPVGSALNASDRQVTQTKLMGMATVISVILNVIFIPMFGLMGAVIASFVSHAALFAGGLIAVNRFLDWPKARLLGVVVRILIAAVGMGAVVYFTKSFVPLPVSIAVGAVAYPALVLAFKAFTVADAKDLVNTVLRRQAA